MSFKMKRQFFIFLLDYAKASDFADYEIRETQKTSNNIENENNTIVYCVLFTAIFI